jgi:hypothetical protein
MTVRLLLALASLTFAACGETSSTPREPGKLHALQYSRIGGVGGITTKLTVATTGSATLDGFVFELDADERAELVAATKDVDFEANAGHDRGDPHPDAFVYGLNVDGRPILARDYVIPNPLSPLINALERLARNHSPERRELEAQARNYLVVFVRDGGIAGEHVELRLDDDGRATVRLGGPPYGDQTFRRLVAPDELAAVTRELDAGDLADLRNPRDPNIVVADGFEYMVITGGTTISAADPIENPRLDRLLLALSQIVDRSRPIE